MIGVVLAGGASRRFGGQAKGLIAFAGRPMAMRVADLLATFCEQVVIEARADAGYDVLGLPLIHAAAAHEDKGPLAGLAAGLALAAPEEPVAFAPCDMPLLRREIYDALAQVGGSGGYARTASGVEPLVAVLGARVRPVLLNALHGETLPRTQVVLDTAGVAAVWFEDRGAFFNLNTPGDLDRLKGGPAA